MTTLIKCLQCGKTFPLRAEAPHKKFHSAKCRYDWHAARRKMALRQMIEREGAPQLPVEDEAAE